MIVFLTCKLLKAEHFLLILRSSCLTRIQHSLSQLTDECDWDSADKQPNPTSTRKLRPEKNSNFFDNLIKQKYSRLSGMGEEDSLLIKSKVPRFGQTIAFNGQARWISLGQVVRLLQRLSVPEEGRKYILQL